MTKYSFLRKNKIIKVIFSLELSHPCHDQISCHWSSANDPDVPVKRHQYHTEHIVREAVLPICKVNPTWFWQTFTSSAGTSSTSSCSDHITYTSTTQGSLPLQVAFFGHVFPCWSLVGLQREFPEDVRPHYWSRTNEWNTRYPGDDRIAACVNSENVFRHVKVHRGMRVYPQARFTAPFPKPSLSHLIKSGNLPDIFDVTFTDHVVNHVIGPTCFKYVFCSLFSCTPEDTAHHWSPGGLCSLMSTIAGTCAKNDVAEHPVDFHSIWEKYVSFRWRLNLHILYYFS